MKLNYIYLAILLILSFQTHSAHCNNITLGKNGIQITSKNSELRLDDENITIKEKHPTLTIIKPLWSNPAMLLTSITNWHYRILAALATILFWEEVFKFFIPGTIKIRNTIVSSPIKLTKTIYSDWMDNKRLRKELQAAREQLEQTNNQLAKQQEEPVITNVKLLDINNVAIQTTFFAYDSTKREVSVTANIYMQSQEQIYNQFSANAPYGDRQQGLTHYSDY